MDEAWPRTTLGEHVELLTGPAFKSAEFRVRPPGTRLARGDNLGPGSFRWGARSRYWPVVSPDLVRYLLNPGDVLLGMDGSKVGRNRAYVTEADLPCLLVQRVARLRATSLHPRFLFALISSERFQGYVDGVKTGTSVPHISPRQITSYAFGLPSFQEQRRIAGVLSVLDDKVDHNSSTAARLEEAGTIAFERLIGRLLMDGNIRDELPDGWRVAALSDVFELNPQRRLTTGTPAPHLEMKNMPTAGHFPEDWGERPVGSGARFMNGDTLVARITPCLENGKIAFVDFLEVGAVGWGSTEYVVMRPKPPLAPAIAYFLARTDDFRGFAVRHMSGTSGRQRVSAESLGMYRVPIPQEERVADLGRELSVVLATIRALRLENRTLTSIRDALRPKLLSGQVRVPESYDPDGILERAVEQAAHAT